MSSALTIGQTTLAASESQTPQLQMRGFAETVRNFAAMKEIAAMMADSSLLPDALLKESAGKDANGKTIYKELPRERKIANCMLVLNQAQLWDCDPFALAQGVSVIHGKVMYEGKIVAAVVNARAGVQEPLRYEFSGDVKKPETLSVEVSGTLVGEHEPRTVTMRWSEGARMGGDAWKNQPDQQLTYGAVRKWARRHAPGVLMGIVEDFVELQQVRQDYLTADPQPPTPPAMLEDAYRRDIVDAITPWHLEHARDQMEQSNLDDLRKERLRAVAVSRAEQMSASKRETLAKSLETIDFADAASVDAWVKSVKEAKGLIASDRDTLRELFAIRKDQLTKPSVSAFDEFVMRIEACDFTDKKAVDILLADVRKSKLSEDELSEIVDAIDKEAAKSQA